MVRTRGGGQGRSMRRSQASTDSNPPVRARIQATKRKTYSYRLELVDSDSSLEEFPSSRVTETTSRVVPTRPAKSKKNPNHSRFNPLLILCLHHRKAHRNLSLPHLSLAMNQHPHLLQLLHLVNGKFASIDVDWASFVICSKRQCTFVCSNRNRTSGPGLSLRQSQFWSSWTFVVPSELEVGCRMIL